MSSVDKTILNEVRQHIEHGDLSEVQHYWKSLQEYEYDQTPDWVYLFQKIYLHACIKKHRAIANWLQTTVFPQMDPIQQIALRQVFSYGKYILNKR